MKTRLLFQQGLGSLALMSSTAWAASNVSFSQSVETVDAYDYVEVTLNENLGLTDDPPTKALFEFVDEVLKK